MGSKKILLKTSQKKKERETERNRKTGTQRTGYRLGTWHYAYLNGDHSMELQCPLMVELGKATNAVVLCAFSTHLQQRYTMHCVCICERDRCGHI